MRPRALTLLLLAACAKSPAEPVAPVTPAAPAMQVVPAPLSTDEVARVLRLSPLPPLPASPTNRVADDPRAARFGQRLFFDQRLSRDGDRACSTCHDPAQGFGDGLALSLGLLPLDRHAPGLINVAHQRWQFWDGRADTLWAQALIPFESPLEHASSRLQVVHVVADDALLRAEYEALFGALPELGDGTRFPPVGRPVPADDHAHKLAAEHAAKAAPKRPDRAGGHEHPDGGHFYHPHQRAWDTMTPADQLAVTRVYVNLGKSIAAYERLLLADSSPFDRFVEGLRDGDEGKLAALGLPARRGLQLFLGRGRCHFCHGGALFSDREFHDLGLDGGDPGRMRGVEALRRAEFVGTSVWSDDPDGEARLRIELIPRHQHLGREFKTPSLRNVAATAPYMHDGRFETLDQVLDFYSSLEEQRDNPPPMETILEPLLLTDRERTDLLAFLRSLTDLDLDPTLTRPVE